MAARRAAEFWLCHRPLGGGCAPVRLLDQLRAAVLRDTAERALAAGFDRVRVFASEPIAGLTSAATLEQTDPRQLIGDIAAAAAAGAEGPVCYAGGGMPAMTAADWAAVRETIAAGGAAANRIFSCDWIGVPDGRVLARAAGESVDNRFALLIRAAGDLTVQSHERSARSLFDIDTPADALVLQIAADVGSLPVGPAARAVLAGWPLLEEPAQRVRQVFDVMTRREVELMVSGRVSGSDWAVLDSDTSCRVRVLSEERGLRTRVKPARSLLAELYQQLGAARFAEVLTNQADAVIWDTRPFLSHLGWAVSRCDRFWADLGRWEAIADPRLRELTARLDGAPVLMGGHSLVSGGLLAAIDAAWSAWESAHESELPA